MMDDPDEILDENLSDDEHRLGAEEPEEEDEEEMY
jgi:hypothetical protein